MRQFLVTVGVCAVTVVSCLFIAHPQPLTADVQGVCVQYNLMPGSDSTFYATSIQVAPVIKGVVACPLDYEFVSTKGRTDEGAPDVAAR